LPASGSFYRDRAVQVEGIGYDLLFSGDHLFMYSPNVEALSVLATYAAVTERIELGTGVLLPALRDPALTAKQVASIDYLSGGRMILGVGVGGEIEQEWQAMEVPIPERGPRTDEYVALMQALWAPEPVNFEGEFRTVRGVVGTPSPVRPGGIPIWVGGRSDAALRRATLHDGWCAYVCSPRRIRESLARIDELMGGERPLEFRTSLVLFVVTDDDAVVEPDVVTVDEPEDDTVVVAVELTVDETVVVAVVEPVELMELVAEADADVVAVVEPVDVCEVVAELVAVVWSHPRKLPLRYRLIARFIRSTVS